MELYNKYRPQTPEEILGNDLAVKSIQKELAAGSHVFLFTGNGGCGKTTAARVFAKIVGADELSTHELNSAENRGIDTVREISEQIRYSSIGGSKSVYILDEMHQQTSASQNALLKVLENCPDSCFFFLCTTNPEKLIQPLKTRCSVVNFKPLEHDVMFSLLRRVAHKEGIKVDLQVFHKIADLSKGSSRDALKILGQVLYLESDEERLSFLDKNTFDDEKAEVVELCRSLLKQEGWAKYMECLEKLKDELSSNAEGVRQAVMGYANAVLKKGMNSAAVGMIQTFSNADCYKNGKFGITVAILDYVAYMQE
jgi:DNA polymerase-3 subunit gamma/tau